MEFIRELSAQKADANVLKQFVVIARLTNLCESIYSVNPVNSNEAEIFCLWGSFALRRDELKCGVRFSLIDCPHAFAWTITYDESRQKIIVHCSMDKSEHEPDFIESIDDFMDEWQNGIKKALG